MARDGALGNLEIGRTPQVRYLKPGAEAARAARESS
jgi:hypothetical protein